MGNTAKKSKEDIKKKRMTKRETSGETERTAVRADKCAFCTMYINPGAEPAIHARKPNNLFPQKQLVYTSI
jgi:hypothetical protein